jgi:hypothetical protein
MKMKTTHLMATLIVVATLPVTTILAQDTGQTETTDKKQEQSSQTMRMEGKMMSNWREQDAELDKLVAEMNSAPADKRLDAVAAVLTKLVEQRKAMHEHMQNMMSAKPKDAMGMCRMMMGMDNGSDQGAEQSHHH